MEIELKLAMAPEAMNRLRRAGWLAALNCVESGSKQLRAVYYDTPERKLRQLGLIYRVRREGQRWVQCIKSGGDEQSVVLARHELERETRSARPELAWVADHLREQVSAEDVLSLSPVFETRVRRETRVVETVDGSRLELAFDRGRITAGGRSCPVSELELELVSGSAGELLAVAEQVVGSVPCRLNTQGKADVGYAVADGEEPPLWQPFPKLRLPREATLEEALLQLVRLAVAQLQAHEACVRRAAHPEGVHQMRIAVRRLRSVLVLLREFLPAAPGSELLEELRWLGGQLGPARDWDVFIGEILAPVGEQLPELAGDEALATRAESRRRRAYGKARAALRDPRYPLLLLRLTSWVMERPWVEESGLREPVAAFAERVLEKRHRRVVKQGKAFGKLSEDDLHELRIRAKKLRYAAEFLAAVYPPKRVRRYLSRLGKLQQALGQANDIAVARDLASRLVKGEADETQVAAGAVIGWHQRVLVEAARSLRETWRRFRRAKPFWE